MNIAQLRLYDLFRKELSLPDDKAALFVAAVEEVVEQKEKIAIQINASKEDIYKLELKLELKIEQTKGDIYKAMFLTGVIQLFAILSGVLAIVKLMIK